MVLVNKQNIKKRDKNTFTELKESKKEEINEEFSNNQEELKNISPGISET